jgi:hypothetical protein
MEVVLRRLTVKIEEIFSVVQSEIYTAPLIAARTDDAKSNYSLQNRTSEKNKTKSAFKKT